MEKEKTEAVIGAAKKTFLAIQNPYKTVEKVFPLAINAYQTGVPAYIGVKDHKSIPLHLIKTLEDTGKYALHTLDCNSLGGRAVDMCVRNPLTGNPMTGSSSGTALNVFYHMNDLGIGTDGGGSVLAPALSLQLFGFISSQIEKEEMEKFHRVSTDGLAFSPSVGLITREWELLKETVRTVLHLPEDKEKASCILASDKSTISWKEVQKISYPDLDSDRETLIRFLKDTLSQCDFMVSYEGPVDVRGMGDSIFGHFDPWTAKRQREAGKGLLRVANMVNADAVCIPGKELGCGWVLLCEGTPVKTKIMLEYAEKLVGGKDELLGRYFGNLDLYFDRGYGKFS
ncbi:amidase family protein [Faecalicatena acetigenes]|jgi:hypothetical protein|uniref:Amidase family protein n=1 Tax=Faecalicatena acetigenes TaxID=2981790 RepID=A0ABT2T9Q6_9FIRM|nr:MULTISPECIES: amidase family protein [Lachnospiraceae]MCU6747018.1 amidase family protein [Faecalicatena acetigenes]SCH58782.1 amidase [uncultured Clostridium sp.]